MSIRRVAIAVASAGLLAGCGSPPAPEAVEPLAPISARELDAADLQSALLTADDLPWGWQEASDAGEGAAWPAAECFSLGPVIEHYEQASAAVFLESPHEAALVGEYLVTATDASAFLADVRARLARCERWETDWPNLDATIRLVPEPLTLASAAPESLGFRWSLSGIPHFGVGRMDILVARSGDLVHMLTFMSFGVDDRAWLRDAIIVAAEKKLAGLADLASAPPQR